MAEPESRNNGLWQHYRATWRTMFAIQSMALVLGLSIAIPVLSLATNRSLARSSERSLSDTDLLDFLVGTNFPLVAFAVLALWWIIHVFGYAAQLFAAHASYHGAPVSVFSALLKTGRALVPLAQLASRFLLQLILIALPFLLVFVGVLSLQLREHNLPHYLSERPPEFILAIAFAFAVFGAMTVAMLRVTARWVYALPLLLFHGEKPKAARRISRKKSRNTRHRAFFTFALWSVGTPSLVLLLNAGWLPLGLRTSELLEHRLGLLSLILSLLILITIVIAVLVGFINLTFLALQHVRLYRSAGLDSEDPPTTPESIISRPLRWTLVVGLIATGLLTIGLSYRWLDGLRIIDHAQIIAHRGASADLPENTVAAVDRAIVHGTNIVAIDVRRWADRGLVVFADPDFSRVAGNPLKLENATEEDLANIDIGSWKNSTYHEERVPTLGQIINLCRDRANLMLYLEDIDDEKQRLAYFNKVAQQIETFGIEKQTRFVCTRPEQVAEFQALRPDWKIGIRSSIMIDRPIGASVSFVIVPAETLRAELISKLHSQNIEVFGADTTDPIVMSSILSRGADGILLAKPRLGHKVVKERAVLNPGERLLIEFISRIRDSLPSNRNSVSQ